MIVYHGTDSLSSDNIITNGINVKYGEKSVDNGRGFYTTPGFEFAKARAIYSASHASEFNKNSKVHPVVLKLDIDITQPLIDGLKIKTFDDCSYQWKQFVFYNRLGRLFLRKWHITSNNHNLDGKFDIVYDETADSHISGMVSDVRYAESISNLEDLINRVDRFHHVYWDKQISFHSNKSLKCIKSMEALDIS